MDRRDILKGAGAFTLFGAAGCVTQPSPSVPPNMEAAFFYAFPLYEMARLEQQAAKGSGLGGAFNTIVHRAELADHTFRAVTAPNNDTVYSFAWLELSGGPIEVVSPTDTERYFSVAFMDMFTDNFAVIGTRATQGQGGRFWVAGPQWAGSPPAGVKVLRSTTNDVWVGGRVLVDGPGDLAAARALQERITVSPVGARGPAKPYAAMAISVTDPENFLAVVNDVLARSPGGKGQTARAALFAAFGIGAGVRASPQMLEAWRVYLPKGIESLRNPLIAKPEIIDGWRYSPRNYGDFGIDDRLRASVALQGVGALIEAEAMYMSTVPDASGTFISGAQAYHWRLPAGGMPVDAFWSLTMYQLESDGRSFLVDNPIRRYSIGDRTRGLVKNADGSLDILIQHEAPAGPLAANWLPSPSGPMRLSLRAYLPRKELRDRTWRVPPIERVS